MEKNGAEIIINDPYISEFKHKGKLYHTVDWEEAIDESDIVIITTDHSCYDYEGIAERAKIVYDTRNATKDVKTTEIKYISCS